MCIMVVFSSACVGTTVQPSTPVSLSPKPSEDVPSGGNYTVGQSTLGKQAGKAQRPGMRTRGEDGS